MLAKVEGEVFVRTDARATNIKFYEEEFVLDDDVKDIGQARVIIRKALLDERLKKSIEHYKKFRTCQVVSLEPTDKKSDSGPVEKKMIEASKLNCVPENLDRYSDSKSKEKALDKAIETKKKRGRPAKKDKFEVEDHGIVD